MEPRGLCMHVCRHAVPAVSGVTRLEDAASRELPQAGVVRERVVYRKSARIYITVRQQILAPGAYALCILEFLLCGRYFFHSVCKSRHTT